MNYCVRARFGPIPVLSLCVVALSLVVGARSAPAQEPAASAAAASSPRVKVLFLGDRGHHKPADRFKQIEPVMKARGIDLTYTDRMADVNADNLKPYDGLLIF